MPTLTMTKGLPASGKTTWARKQNAKRVNKDDLRAMIDNGKWSKANEKNILAARDNLVAQFLRSGYDVIVDDTNLAPKHEEDLRQAAELFGAEFEVKDFTDVSLSTCLKRDSERANSVGEKVIRDMYKTFLKPKGIVAQYNPPPYNEDLPTCIIVDIDGTVAHGTGRSPYDYSLVRTDVADETIREIVRRYAGRNPMEEIPDTYIVIVSGREDSCKSETVNWLENNGIPFDELHMRKSGDRRDDRIVKKEIYDEWIKNRYNVRFVLDDRDRVVTMWREIGLKCLQVEPGAF
jgi:predicted kinase